MSSASSLDAPIEIKYLYIRDKSFFIKLHTSSLMRIPPYNFPFNGTTHI